MRDAQMETRRLRRKAQLQRTADSRLSKGKQTNPSEEFRPSKRQSESPSAAAAASGEGALPTSEATHSTSKQPAWGSPQRTVRWAHCPIADAQHRHHAYSRAWTNKNTCNVCTAQHARVLCFWQGKVETRLPLPACVPASDNIPGGRLCRASPDGCPPCPCPPSQGAQRCASCRSAARAAPSPGSRSPRRERRMGLLFGPQPRASWAPRGPAARHTLAAIPPPEECPRARRASQGFQDCPRQVEAGQGSAPSDGEKGIYAIRCAPVAP